MSENMGEKEVIEIFDIHEFLELFQKPNSDDEAFNFLTEKFKKNQHKVAEFLIRCLDEVSNTLLKRFCEFVNRYWDIEIFADHPRFKDFLEFLRLNGESNSEFLIRDETNKAALEVLEPVPDEDTPSWEASDADRIEYLNLIEKAVGSTSRLRYNSDDFIRIREKVFRDLSPEARKSYIASRSGYVFQFFNEFSKK